MTGRDAGSDDAQITPVLLTANEQGWIDFIRLISDGRDPPPSLAAVQALRRVATAPEI